MLLPTPAAMDVSSSFTAPFHSSARPIQPSPSSLVDKFLGMSISPASAQSLSSDTTDANEADELDEQELWDMDISNSSFGRSNGDSARGQASLPPRILSAGRIAGSRSSTPERRSPLRDAGMPRVSSAMNSLSSISSVASNNGVKSPSGRILSVEASARRIPPASRMIPRVASHDGRDAPGRMMPQSAPLNIPDWSKLVGRTNHLRRLDMDDDQGDEEEEKLPPHEFLARECSRSQMASFSVLEGAGRTLKGRDMSRVRNAVLSYTGFLE